MNKFWQYVNSKHDDMAYMGIGQGFKEMWGNGQFSFNF